MTRQRLNICMVSDFFYPNMGGVENHLFNLSQCLISRGHKVVIITHCYGDRNGVRWLSKGLKVYYLPVLEMYNQCTLPAIFGNFPFMRSIFVRERINHIHGHQAFSSLCHEAIFHGRTMGLTCTFTDHSLFGFADTSSILTNKLLKFTLSDVDNVICVSHTSKENTVLRASLDPKRVFVIPNAVIPDHFTPDPSQKDPKFITIVVISRLVYRKGIDLLVAVIPRICALNDRVRFIIAGDGPKKVDLEQMRDEHLLHHRVELIGALPSEKVRDSMVRGDIFLNTSLTEAFCMAILEAASCGLFVVSTRVGGIPEVLPDDMILLTPPDEDDLTETLLKAIHMVDTKQIDTSLFHKRISTMSSWSDVAARTESLYYEAQVSRKPENNELVWRMAQYYGCGELFGKIACILAIVDFLFLIFLEWLRPVKDIDVAPDFNYSDKEYVDLLKSHTAT